VQHRTHSADDGFALLEVMVASALLIAIAAGVTHVVAAAVRVSHEARVRTMTSTLAAQKLEQLRSLPFAHMSIGDPPVSMPSSDVSTDLSTEPPGDSGPGLQPSPPETLTTNVPFYVDYLGASGEWVGRGASVPAGTVYTRRWAVRPLAADPDNVLVLQVLVTTGQGDASRLVTLKARRP
jgi:hypothetical protein